MTKKPTTLDDLAAMMNGGFSSMQKQINDVKDTMKNVAEELPATHEDVRYVRNTMTMLVESDAAHEAAMESLRKCVERVERKVGITKLISDLMQHHTTIDDLAHMINDGFKTTATKEDLQAVTTRLDGIDLRLDRIDHLLLAEQKRKVEDLEKRMKKLEDALAV